MRKAMRFIVPAVWIVLMIAIHLCFLVYKVNGDSMNPNLHNGEYGVAVRTTISQVDRFNVVIISTPEKYIIKRVIGLPGDTVCYADGKLFINDEEVNDKWANGTTEDFYIELGNNEYFCLGDNREHSTDSRWYGPFTKHDIKAVIIERGI